MSDIYQDLKRVREVAIKYFLHVGARESFDSDLWRGLPPSDRQRSEDILAEIHQKGGTVVMSTHQLREALELATHVTLIQRGQIAYSGERSQEMLADTGWLYRTYGEN